MPRERSPNRDKAFEIYKEHKGNIDLVEIANTLKVSDGTVRGWKNKDKWEDKLNGTFQKKTSKNTERSNKNKSNKKVKKQEPKLEEVEEIINSELTDKQRLFCIYYIRNFNATQAYLKAYECSYDVANAHGYELLSNVVIKSEIHRLKELKKQSIMLTEDDIVERHMRIAFADITDFVSFGRKDIEIDRDKDDKPIMAQINYVDFKNSYEVDGGLISEIKSGKQGVSLKLEDKQKSLDWLANFFEWNPMNKHKKEYDNARLSIERERIKLATGIADSNINVNSKDDSNSLTPEERRKRIDELISKRGN